VPRCDARLGVLTDPFVVDVVRVLSAKAAEGSADPKIIRAWFDVRFTHSLTALIQLKSECLADQT
jgi:hypothetical protein